MQVGNSIGEIAIAWTVRVSMLCFFLVLTLRASPRTIERFPMLLRALWAIGFLAMVMHVLVAFGVRYAWNHDFAIAETARQTRELTGQDFKGGIYFNYAFLAVWAVDVLMDWIPPILPRRIQAWFRGAIALFLIFIAFNGLVVFESGWLRWIGLVATVLLVAAWFQKWIRLRSDRREP